MSLPNPFPQNSGRAVATGACELVRPAAGKALPGDWQIAMIRTATALSLHGCVFAKAVPPVLLDYEVTATARAPRRPVQQPTISDAMKPCYYS
jgi:hypothetical protein